jgi:excisionase family DNA binding protein
MGEPEQKLLNVTETAKRLGVHPNTIRNWARDGLLTDARVPGTRYLRFHLEDVERLARERAQGAGTLERERRTIGPELIGAAQLHEWAGTREAQAAFPELIRRLLAATPGITGLSMRSGEGVGTPGWDGRAHAQGVSWLPGGELRFELGTGQDPRDKANKEHDKRAREPDAGQLAFVFATPRLWKDAEKWADEHRPQSPFADVRAIDADTLEGLLLEHVAVHYWISERLGRTPGDAQTLERWSERLANRTDPPLPEALFLAGRSEQAEKLAAFLAGEPGVLAVQTGWREEAIAFVNAALTEHEPRPLALTISTHQAWGRAMREQSKALLIPLFDEPDTDGVKDCGHHVILPLGREERSGAVTLTLPPLHPIAAAEALRAGKFKFNEADELAALARRSMPALIRRKARDTRIARPDWAATGDGETIAPLVLIGRWRTSAADTEIVSRLVGEEWEGIERRLLKWHASEDPPLVKAAAVWHLASPDDAFLFLSGRLTPSELERWHEILAEVLLEHDPLFDLSSDEQPTAGLRGIGLTRSRELRAGLADAVALAGALDDGRLGEHTGEEHATRAVRMLLDAANADDGGGVWASLSDVLPRLAEGAPEAFLRAVHADLDRPEPVLRGMFRDRDRASWLIGSSPHTGLLWALETLAWSGEHLLEACRALAKLAEIDPGGRLGNRPPRSLQAILVGWIRQTEATLEEKLAAVGAICRQHPEVAWELVLSLWPQSHAVTSPPSHPVHRSWAPEQRGVATADWLRYIERLVELAIEMAGADSARWATLVGRLGPLPPGERERLTGALAELASEQELEPAQRLELWEALRHEIARHRRFPTADWSMGEEALAPLSEIARQVKPTGAAEASAHLFEWHPDISGVDTANHDRYDQALEGLREQAVRRVLEEQGTDGLRTLALRSVAPSTFGWQLPKVADEQLEGELFEWLDSDEQSLRVAASQWAGINMHRDGEGWLKQALERIPAEESERRTMIALSMPHRRALWDALGRLDPQLADTYWRRAGIWVVEVADIEHAARQLLSRNRPWTALDVVATPLQGPEPKSDAVPAALVCDVLDAALAAGPGESQSQVPGYALGLLLDHLEASSSDLQQVARYEFAFFRLLEDIRRPRSLYAALAADPAWFVELACRVYRGDNEPERENTPAEADLATHAWWILEDWHELPGRGEGADVDAEHLNGWVAAAREAFAQADRDEIGDDLIGKLLAASPDGEDGLWPAEPVRELIETLQSGYLESGVQTGVINARGFTSRGVLDGGQQERELAQRYERFAKELAAGSPRTARLLRELAKSYRRDARREDDRAAVTASM